ncbi:MAG: ABC transporter permease [Halothiobacillaceae bacterium]
MSSTLSETVDARSGARATHRLRRIGRWRPTPGGLTLAAIAFPIAIPILVVLFHLVSPDLEVWNHLRESRLGEYVGHSLMLMIGVAIGVLALGVPTAWLTARYDFPGRRLVIWALMLPLAMPAYIVAYAYIGILDYTGPVQTLIRDLTGWQFGDYWFPQIRSVGGAVLMLSLVFYPYVYLLARSAFLEQSASLYEVARLANGHGGGLWNRLRHSGFARVGLPLARPAIVAGLMLALMETLADYGTVQVFGVTTLTTGIFRSWYGMGQVEAAAQLAGILTLFVLALLVLERSSRRRAAYHHPRAMRRIEPVRLQGGKGMAALAFCLVPVTFGFLLPVLQLLGWSLINSERFLDADFIRLAGNTLMLAAAAAALVVALAVVIVSVKRARPSRARQALTDLSTMGYAIPGAVIAVGIFIPLGFVDNTVDSWMRATFGISTGLLLSGTLFALLFAYAVRFMSLGVFTVDAGMGRLRPAMLDAARALGQSPRGVLFRVTLPMIRGSLLTAALLVFVEVLKELPATLVLRPFNFNTLAVRTFELANDEMFVEAAIPALTIVLIGLIPVILLSRAVTRQGEQ